MVMLLAAAAQDRAAAQCGRRSRQLLGGVSLVDEVVQVFGQSERHKVLGSFLIDGLPVFRRVKH